MVRFLLNRPIAVIMAFLAVVILGCVTFVTLPVSLLPDVSIPHISVQVTGENMSARELENTIVTPLRRHLMQVSGLNDIRSSTRDASAVIDMTMNYGVNTDLAFIEVNEKIDAAMNSMPRDVARPKAIKASATDIPVLYLSMTLSDGNDNGFVDLSDVAADIVRRRLEQLPEVSMVDVTGIPSKELRIIPDENLMHSAALTVSDITRVLNANNAEPGSMTVRDGYYEYNIQVANHLRTPEDVRAIKIRKDGRLYTLGDFCRVELTESNPVGYSTYNGRRAVTMAIIKHGSESMKAMEKAVDETVSYFASQYPDIQFSKSRSQTELLDFTISNLEQNLILGLILVFLTCAIFMRSMRLPFVIGITIIIAVIITFLLFYFFHVSLNIISLAGLILAVGMMIDNSVIVAENITQYRQHGLTLEMSCIDGTNEMITPMLSSSLTTVAVFVPLIFMSGIAGAIFADQAFAITAGLGASYVVGITLLPVMYFLFYRGKNGGKERPVKTAGHTDNTMTRLYDKGIEIIFAHKALSITFVAIAVAAVWPLAELLDTERMPYIDSTETVLAVDWNENITLDENLRRARLLSEKVDSLTVEHSAYIGIQDYMLGDQGDMGNTEAEIYLRVNKPQELEPMRRSLAGYIESEYPQATLEFNAPVNVFERVFSSTDPPLEVRLSAKSGTASSQVNRVSQLKDRISQAIGQSIQEIPLRSQINLTVNHERLELYNIDYSTLREVLQTTFRGVEAATLRSYQDYIPVRISDRGKSIEEVLAETLVPTRPDRKGVTGYVPLRMLVSASKGTDFKTIRSDEGGEYIPLAFDINESRLPAVIETVQAEVAADNGFDVDFTGSLFSNRIMMRELTVILIVSLLLMYFILCAQLESFMQPLIVLLEIPIDITFALLSLWIFGQTLNLMSAIGIIVTCGIVVNDSILKLDAINELRKAGMPLLEAIHTAGQRRLKPIIMTSLTTIFAMVPVLFTSDMGSELQRPLAIAMIGSMVVGTLVSIFIIPLVYYLIYRKHHVSA